jgi:hypothetical protein
MTLNKTNLKVVFDIVTFEGSLAVLCYTWDVPRTLHTLKPHFVLSTNTQNTLREENALSHMKMYIPYACSFFK